MTKGLPRFAGSLRGRLVLSAAAFVLAAVLCVGWLIAALLEDVLQAEVEGRLDLQIASVSAALVADPAVVGAPPPPGERGRRGREAREERRERGERERREADARLSGGDLDGPPFDRPDTGWFWVVEGDGERFAASRSLGDRPLGFDPDDLDFGRRGDRSAAEADASDRPVLVRGRRVEPRPGDGYLVIAAAPRSAVTGPLRAASLTAAGVPAEQPSELVPLAREINALIEHDAQTLRQARLHVANLAHGLKTPLATLSAAIERRTDGADRAALLGLATLMDKRIGHHLRRARGAALGGGAEGHVAVETVARDLVLALDKMAGDRRVVARVAVDPALRVAVGEEDLSEMLGNLLDNAWRHAASRVAIEARREGAEARIAIEDDGPGLSPAEIEAVLQPGRRLDERAPGFGFGLPIAAELAALNGGALVLGRAPLGGLSAVMTLPSVRPAAPG